MASGVMRGVDYFDLLFRRDRELFPLTSANSDAATTLNGRELAPDAPMRTDVAIDVATNLFRVGDAHIRESSHKKDPPKARVLDNISFFTVRLAVGPVLYHNCPMIHALAATLPAASQFIEDTLQDMFQLGVGAPLQTQTQLPLERVQAAKRVVGLLKYAIIVATSMNSSVQWPTIVADMVQDAQTLVTLAQAYLAWCNASIEVSRFASMYRRGDGPAPQTPTPISAMHIRDASSLCTQVRNELALLQDPVRVTCTGLVVPNPCASSARITEAGVREDDSIAETNAGPAQQWTAAALTQGYLCSALYYWSIPNSAGLSAACMRVAWRNGAHIDTGFLTHAEGVAHARRHPQSDNVEARLKEDAEKNTPDAVWITPFTETRQTLLSR